MNNNNRKVLSNITNINTAAGSGKENHIDKRNNINSQSGMIHERDDESSDNYNDVTSTLYSIPPGELVENIDIGDMQNEFACAMYAEDVYNYLNSMERNHRLPVNFLQIQPHVTPKLRAYCIDWQVDVHKQLSQTFGRSLQVDTLFLSISILDRFLSRKAIAADKLHLVGLGAFFIACKYEETYYPSIDQLLRFVPEAGRKDDVLRIERIILNELRYALGIPTIITFLKRYAKAAHADSTIGMLSRFMSEYSLTSYSLCSNYLPSMIAACATSHALRIVGRPPWTATLQHYTGYSFAELSSCLVEIKEVIKKAPLLKTQAVYKKYSDSKYLKAAVMAVQKI